MTFDAGDRDDTRQRVLDAALEVFLEKGYAEARVQEIADRAGFTTGAIYSNFDGKASLFAETIERAGLAAVELMSEALLGSESDITLGLVSAVAQTQTNQPFHVLLLDALAASSRDPEVRKAVLDRVAVVRDNVIAWVDSARKRGEIDATITTDALVELGEAWIIGAAVRRAIGIEPPPFDDVSVALARAMAAFGPEPPR